MTGLYDGILLSIGEQPQAVVSDGSCLLRPRKPMDEERIV